MPSLTLEEIAHRARTHTITAAEKRAQRISLIAGVLDSKSTLTKEGVADLLNQIEGHEGEVWHR